MRVKLVFEKANTEIRGMTNNTFSKDVDVELPSNMDAVELVAAKCYDPNDAVQDGQPVPSASSVAVIWDYHDENTLIGKLLTYIDATYTDKEQREAHKRLIKDMVYGYYEELRQRSHQTIESQSKR